MFQNFAVAYRRGMDYVHMATAVRAAQHLLQWIRAAGTRPLQLDRMTDETERALVGERPDSPFHRYRYRR